MGIGFVLVFWGVFGSGLALGGALVLRALASALTRSNTPLDASSAREQVLRFAAKLPIYCLIWVAAVFVFQAVVNSTLLDRDIGLGDSWSCPLPNGYAILMIDVTDQGAVFNPRTQGGSSVGDQQDAITGVSQLQVAGPYILGAFDSESFKHFEQNTPSANGYFLLDTRAGTHVVFDTEEQLRDAARNAGVSLHLQPINEIFDKYRYTWFDYLAGALFVAVPIGLLIELLRRILKIRKDAVRKVHHAR